MQHSPSWCSLPLTATSCSSDDGLYEREYDDELYARDFDEDLYARELADAIYARALEARNRRRRPSISHVAEHITNVAGAVEAVGNAHAALHSRYVAIVPGHLQY